MALTTTIDIDIPGIKGLANAIVTGNAPEINTALKQWGARYRAFAQRRFDTFSKGAGDWPPIKPRRHGRDKVAAEVKASKGKKPRGPTILRDTNLLFLALSPAFTGRLGSFQDITSFTVTVGYTDLARHVNKETGKTSKVSIAQIVRYHDRGAGNLPIRRIIVLPPQHVVDGCKRDMSRALMKIYDRLKKK